MFEPLFLDVVLDVAIFSFYILFQHLLYAVCRFFLSLSLLFEFIQYKWKICMRVVCWGMCMLPKYILTHFWNAFSRMSYYKRIYIFDEIQHRKWWHDNCLKLRYRESEWKRHKRHACIHTQHTHTHTHTCREKERDRK